MKNVRSMPGIALTTIACLLPLVPFSPSFGQQSNNHCSKCWQVPPTSWDIPLIHNPQPQPPALTIPSDGSLALQESQTSTRQTSLRTSSFDSRRSVNAHSDVYTCQECRRVGASTESGTSSPTRISSKRSAMLCLNHSAGEVYPVQLYLVCDTAQWSPEYQDHMSSTRSHSGTLQFAHHTNASEAFTRSGLSVVGQASSYRTSEPRRPLLRLFRWSAPSLLSIRSRTVIRHRY